MITRKRACAAAILGLLIATGLSAQQTVKTKSAAATNQSLAAQALAAYLTKVRQVESATTPTAGSIWVANGRYANLAADYKASNVNDVITIEVVELTQAAGTGTVSAKRSNQSSTGFSGLLGPLSSTNKFTNIFSPTSSSDLEGQAQTASSTQLSTTLTGRVVDVLPNGFLVVEAVRTIEIDNEQQTLIVHGVVRPADVSANNEVLSTQVGDMEVKLVGRGVISDATQQPNVLVRVLQRLLEF